MYDRQSTPDAARSKMSGVEYNTRALTDQSMKLKRLPVVGARRVMRSCVLSRQTKDEAVLDEWRLINRGRDYV